LSLNFPKLKLHIVSIPKDFQQTVGALPSAERVYLNRLFQFWKKAWEGTFKELGSEGRDFHDHFQRFSFVASLEDENGELVSFLCSTHYDLDLLYYLDHSYIHRFPRKFTEDCLRTRTHQVASLEYCYVSSFWRKAKLEFSLVDVMLCLCGLEAFRLGANRLVAVTRNDRAVNSHVYNRGGVACGASEVLHNVPVDLISISKSNFVFDPQLHALDAWIAQLWKSRRTLNSMTKMERAFEKYILGEEGESFYVDSQFTHHSIRERTSADR